VTPAILKAVGEYFHLPPEAIFGKRRNQKTNLARKIAIYLLREEMNLPFSHIANELGLAKSSIIYAYKDICQKPHLLNTVAQIRGILQTKKDEDLI
jgi:chromosomal replication initiation ATPase DnaA